MAAAASVLIVLLIAPPTRWLVRLQAFPGLVGGGPGRAGFVRDHPNDYQIQLGGQGDAPGQTPVQYARSLVPRFPDSPSLRANILRYATTDEVHLKRPEEDMLLASAAPQTPAGNSPGGSRDDPPDAAALAAFDADAAAGERLDPDNAYFPFMRAVGLFAANRDAEGQAAVLRAGTKTAWREYYQDEVEGRWRSPSSRCARTTIAGPAIVCPGRACVRSTSAASCQASSLNMRTVAATGAARAAPSA